MHTWRWSWIPIHNIWIQFLTPEECTESLHRDTGLGQAWDERGQSGQRKPKYVEEGESHEGFVSCQSFVGIVEVHQRVGGKRNQSNLQL